MKINRIYIAAFGGLKNKTIDFKDGFSVIYGENENGKTTIMTFIKMMFYGSERGSSSIAKNPRKKYAPWSGEKSAGSIDFEHGGRSYRLEREFGNTNSSDYPAMWVKDFSGYPPPRLSAASLWDSSARRRAIPLPKAR